VHDQHLEDYLGRTQQLGLLRKNCSGSRGELAAMQEWMRAEATRLVTVFEGQYAAGKGNVSLWTRPGDSVR
jgi:polyphosphate kinase 2 (PPK2 family)